MLPFGVFSISLSSLPCSPHPHPHPLPNVSPSCSLSMLTSKVPRYAQLYTPYAPHSPITLGDILVVCTQMLVGMYIFELIYRVKVSHISSMHHIGTITVAEAAIAISLNLTREKDATIEFILCTVWGTSSSPPHPPLLSPFLLPCPFSALSLSDKTLICIC